MKIPELDLSNTPGVYYALAYGFSALLYIRLNPMRTPRWKCLLKTTGIWCVLFLLMLFTYKIRIEMFIPCVMIEIGLVWLMIRESTVMPLLNTFYFTARAFLLGELAASLEWQLFYFALTTLGMPLRMWSNILFLLVCHGFLFTLIRLLERRFEEGNRQLVISRRQWLTVLALTMIVYALSNISYVIRISPFSSSLTQEIFTIRTLADLGGVAILFGYHMTLMEIQSRKTVESLEQVMQMQMEQYRISEETIDLINRKYHDLKHQIAYLKSDITEEEKRVYLDEMEEEVRIYEAQNRTGNHVVDTILTEKSLLCRNEEITLSVMADGRAMSFLSVQEICALLGNALDNAIEAAAEMKHPEERLIHLQIDRNRMFLRIRVENRFEGERQISDGIPVTTKKDHSMHGFGIRSMKTITEAREGSFYTQIRDGWFKLSILIPLPEPSGDH